MASIINQSYVPQFINLLRMEAEAITCAAAQLQPEQIEQAVRFLATCQGKVVLIGMGKSSYMARKIAATMTSTGTMAIFLHPSDALHGDLGIITSKDIAVVLSNSGETDELVNMLPYLKHRQVPIIAIVGNVKSTLARHADAVLNASVDKEACPLNLAPTTSTTVSLAIGDALAMTLMKAKGITPEDFALNHPAGRLGKRLTLRVKDLMHTDLSNINIPPQASWIEIISAIGKAGLGAVNVIDDEGRMMGIITDGDLRRSMQRIRPTELENVNALAIMTRDPVKATLDMLAYDALQLMENRPSQISVLPVVDSAQRGVGLLRLHDIVRSGI